MLATLADRSFDRDGWIFEIKWDGYRALAQIAGSNISIYSRNLRDFTGKFDSIKRSLGKIPYDIILDGEIIITDSQGRSDFSGLRKYLKTGKGNPVYYVFDILYISGYSLLDVPLLNRKEILELILPELSNIKISSHIHKTGKAFFAQAEKNGLEGIMAKKADSPYELSARSKNWLKIKIKHTQDIVIGGYIKSPGNRSFRSIIAGIYEDRKLIHIGNVGSGFSQDEARILFNRLKKITRAKSPFSKKIKDSRDFVWVEPEIAAEVKFSQWTPDGYLRHPVFKAIRDDKKPLHVIRESVWGIDMNDQGNTVKSSYRGKLTNPGKIFWPEEGYSKKDLFEFYREISGFILPHIIGRPQSLHRHPDGINGESFFQKDTGFKPPSWLETFLVTDKERSKGIHYLVCRDLDSLLYMINLGCIEINPWLSRVEDINRPDFIVIDLDPTGTGFSKVVSAALKAREILDMLDIKSYIKTSGATGLHIYVPTGSKYDYSQALQFANILAIVIKRKTPGISSIERSPGKRHGKVYLDYLQNRPGQTIAAPYCIRPKPGAPVSTPLFWEELEDLKDPAEFNIKSILKRLEKYGDIWEDIYNKNLDMEKVLSNIQGLYGESSK